LSIQRTNEFVVSLVAALDNAEALEREERPAPVIVQQKAPKENMKIGEAADYCGYAKSYMYQLVYRKAIPCHRPMNGRIFFKRKELDEFIGHGKQDAGYEVMDKAAAILNGEIKQ
jgi:excisionase family DNA binding protein